jgi:hypothetical protein
VSRRRVASILVRAALEEAFGRDVVGLTPAPPRVCRWSPRVSTAACSP